MGVGDSRSKEVPCLFSLTQHALELHFSHMLSVTYPASPYVSVVRLQAPSCCELRWDALAFFAVGRPETGGGGRGTAELILTHPGAHVSCWGTALFSLRTASVLAAERASETQLWSLISSR